MSYLNVISQYVRGDSAVSDVAHVSIDSYIRPLQSLQNRVARCVTGNYDPGQTWIVFSKSAWVDECQTEEQLPTW